jgi:hypothetical protein
MRASFTHLRKTRHTHDPVDDARGNAEAMLHKSRDGTHARSGASEVAPID